MSRSTGAAAAAPADRVLAGELSRHAGSAVLLRGWVHRQRDLGGVCFLLLRDRSGLCQVVFRSAPTDATGNPITLESVVEVRGVAAANGKAPGGYEVQAEGLAVISSAAPDLPLAVNQDPAQLSLDAMLEHRMVSLRNPKTLSIFRLQAEIVRLFAEHLRAEGFTEIKSSKLIGSGTEGGTGLFAVEYFDRTVYLAQSPQLYKQALVAAGLERVFEIGMAYRAEKHDTPRHINEYVSLDVEMAFIDSEHDLMDLEQRLLGAICAGLERAAAAILALWDVQVPSAAAVAAIPRLTHDEARAVVGAATGRRVYEINPEGERLLCEWAAAEHGVDAAFIYWVSAAQAALLHLPHRRQQDHVLRPAVPRPGDNLRQPPHQRPRCPGAEPATLRPGPCFDGGLPVGVPLRLPPARRASPSAWSGSPRPSSAWPASSRRPCSPATASASAPDAAPHPAPDVDCACALRRGGR